MASSSFSAMSAHRINRMLPVLRAETQQLTSHVNFLASIGAGGSLDARELVTAVNSAKLTALRIDKELGQLIQTVSSIRRRDLGDMYGPFRGNLRALVRQLEKDFKELDKAIERLDNIAGEKINDPARWREVGIPGLISLIRTACGIARLQVLKHKQMTS